MKYEYKEGEQASTNFERAMTTIFKAPKESKAVDASEKPSARKKPKSGSDKD
jgi:hypothetical protein